MSTSSSPTLRQLSTPHAAGLAGVIFALLFATVLILIRTNMREGVGDTAEWLRPGHRL